MDKSHKIAIIVAIITALGGVIAAFVATQFTPEKDPITLGNTITIERSNVGGDVVGGDKSGD